MRRHRAAAQGNPDRIVGDVAVGDPDQRVLACTPTPTEFCEMTHPSTVTSVWATEPAGVCATIPNDWTLPEIVELLMVTWAPEVIEIPWALP